MTDRNNLPTKDIALASYTSLVTITKSPEFLETSMAALETARLVKALAWVNDLDPKGAPFRFLEDDGEPMPESVQRLYGKIFLNGLNRLRVRAEELLAERTAAAAF